ncbi:peptidase M16 [Christiangramia fulva]|uniref:Peptidase M16 n=1 Tax=Christiangramia fulva TaxID=2126553 RepID=A0A2R3ZAM2_9FLAO|nr:pitrilysin family protein [Christiangramia fulva]AVR47319.1 peptidase M16 [Christiangramia fulva]
MKKLIITLNIFLFLGLAVNAQIDRTTQPEPGPAPKINLQKPEVFTLDNGLTVMVVENHKLPRVNMTLLLDNAPHSEGEKAGVSGLAGGLLGTGTTKTSKDEFNEELDFLGANVNFSASGARANTLSKFFPKVLNLMAEGALQPKFSQEEFDKLKDRQIESLKSNENDVNFNAGRVRRALTYGKEHPYGEFTSVETLKNVSLEDVKNYYNTYFVPNNAYLAIVGDINLSEAKKLVKENFSSWKNKSLPKENLTDVTNVDKTQIDFINMPNAVQSVIAVTNSAQLKKNDPDYFPAIIANYILGSNDGRLFNNIREDKGYAYAANSYLNPDRYIGSFIATAEVRNEVTDSAVVAFLDEIHRIRNEKVSKEELQNAKNKYIGNFVLSLEQPSTIAGYALDIKTENLPADFYENYLKKINEVTAEDVQRVANKYFKIDNARIVVAGKASEVAEDLENLTYNGKNIPVKYFDKKANLKEKPDFASKMDPSITVEKVFNDYIKAIGGRDAINDVKSVVMTADAEIQGMTLNMELKRTAEGKLHQTISMNGNVMNEQVFNGDAGFIRAMGQKMDFNEEQVEAAKADASPFPELTPGDASVKGIEQVNGEDAYVVQLDKNTKAYYDVDSGLKVQTVKTMEQGGRTMTVPTGYSDYREVEGVKFPFQITSSAGPQTFTFNVNEILVNEGVSEEDFKLE